MNNFAISSTGIGEALQRSASALYEAGNTIDESVALITAANSVVQNPEQVGTALKTLSLRLRGTKTELEEAGEDTDGMAESVSQLQAKLKALTHGKVDIMADTNTFKNTTEILREMSQAWQDMTDIERASALELMGGKRQANILSSIITNFQTVEDVIQTSSNASGSALAENEKYLDSIQGRIDLFTNSLQTMWMNFIDSDALKFIIDLGRGVVELIDKFGLFKTAIAGTFTYLTTFSKNKIDILSIFGIHDLENGWFAKFKNQGQESVNIYQSLASVLSSVRKTTFEMGSDLEMGKQIDILNSEWSKGQENFASYVSSLSDANVALKAYIASVKDGNFSLAGFQEFITQHNAKVKASGIAAKAAAVGHQLFNAAISMGISLLVGAAISAITKLINAEKEAAESAREAIDTYKNSQETLKSQKKTVDELASSYKKLSSGVNTETNTNIGLTTESYQEYLSVCNQIADMFPQLIAGYDSEGNAILTLKGQVEDLTKAYEDAAKAASSQFLTKDNKKDIWTAYTNTLKKDKVFKPIGSTIEQKEILDFLDKLNSEELETLLNSSRKKSPWYLDSPEKSEERWKLFSDALSNAGYDGVYLQNGKLWNFLEDTDIDFSGISEQIKSGDITLTDGLNKLKSNISIALSNVDSTISSALGDIKQTVSAKLLWDDEYQKLDKDTKSMVNAIVNNLDAETISQMGAKSIDDVVTKIMSNLQKADQNIVNGIFTIQDDISSAMAKGDSTAFISAKNSFYNLIPNDWQDKVTGEIIVDENADVVTRYLQTLAQQIQEQSKNYEVKLQMKTEFESPSKVNELVTKYTGEYADEIQKAFNRLGLGDQATMKDIYEYISKNLAGEDSVLRSDELTDLYNQWVEAGTPDSIDGWENSQMAAIQALDAVMKLYGTDIDTVKSKLIDFGYVAPSLNDVASFDLSSEATQKKVEKFESNIASIKKAWNSLNDKEMTKSEFIDLAADIPEVLNDVDLSDDNWMIQAKKNLEELNNTKIQDFIDMLTNAKAAMESRGEDTSIVDSFIGYANELKSLPLLEIKAKPETITGLTEAYDKYKSVLEETNEIIYDGQQVSDGYYESLKEYITDLDALDKCFDKNNKNIVKNVAGLKKLIAQQKQENINTLKNAKAQTMLQYSKIVQRLTDATSAYEKNTSAGFNEIDSLLEQIDTLEDTIDQYKNLELALLGVTNAFNEFEKAKQRDSETDYQSSLEEMIDALTEGFDSGNVGTEAFNAAIKGLFTPDLYGEVIDSVEDLDNIWEKYSQGFLSSKDDVNASGSFFTRTDDGIKVTEQNMRNFVDAAQKMGVLTGDSFEEFDVIAGTSLDVFAEKMGMTKDMAYAYLDMLSNRTIGAEKLTSQLADVTIDKDIENVTTKLKEATQAKIELLRSGKYNPEDLEKVNADIQQYTDELNKANQAAIDHSKKYSALSAIQASFGGELNLSKEELDNLATALGEVDGKTYVINTDTKQLLDSQGNVYNIKEMLDTLGSKPTELQIKLQYEDAEKKINELEKKKDDLKLNPKIDSEQLDQEIAKVDHEIQKYKSQQKTLEILYGFKPSKEGEDTYESFSAKVAEGIDTEIRVNTTEATAKIDETREKAEKPMETTLTVNTVTGETDVTTTGANGATVDFHVGGGYQEVLNKLAYLTTQCKIPIEQKVEVSDEDSSGESTIQTVKDDLIDLQNIEVDDKTFDVIMNGYETVKTQLDNILSDLTSIDGKSATATVTVNTVNNQSSGSTTNTGTPTKRGSGRPTMANGTAHAQGDWGAPKTETALVGELGPEAIVRNGKWFTVGNDGAEFTQVQRGDIIFNHEQTRQLLENGYVTSRGKLIGGSSAFAEGTAYAKTYSKHYNFTGDQVTSGDDLTSTIGDLSDAADDLSDATDDFREVFDWVEVRLQEIDETLDLLNAKLENAVGYVAQNSIIDQMLGVSSTKMTNLQAGLEEYTDYAAKLLAEVPTQYQEAAQNGAIAITEFAGEADEATLEAINNYREWADKVADLTQQIEELNSEIANLAKQKFDNISNQYDNTISLIENANEKLKAQIDLMEDSGYVAATQYYESMIENTKLRSAELEKEKQALQEMLDQQVELGNIKVGSDAWYEMVNQLYEVDAAIVECTSDLENYQNAINDIYWDNFDELINRIDYLNNETQNLINLMDNADMVTNPDNENGWTADQVEWTEEGLASLGLYAQQMEIAEYKARQYAQAIDDLNKDYEDGKYSESEYLEKLNELKNGQYDAIESYYDAQDGIKELNKTRIDAIKSGIEKEINAYTKLIEKKKEELNSEKDLYDFQKNVTKQQQSISDIQRKLAALSTDNSAAAIAKRKKLEAELAQAKADLEESYYDRSVSDKSDALDKELEDFENEKNNEVEKWEKYLDDIEKVIADSLGVVQANATGIYNTLNTKAGEYNLALSNAILSPWQNGALAVDGYQTKFNTSMSSTMSQLEAMRLKWVEIINTMAQAAGIEIQNQEKENEDYTAATYVPLDDPTPSSDSDNKKDDNFEPQYDTYTVKNGDNLSSIAQSQLGSASRWKEIYDLNKDLINDPDLIYPGWKLKIPKYAKGTYGVTSSGLGIVDEDQLEELILGVQNGRLTYLSKGSSVIPADLTSNLMSWGKLDPQDMIDRNRPAITAPHIVNNEISVNMNIAEVIHVDTVTNDTIPDLTKAVQKQMDSYMAKVNNSLKRYTRG